MVRRGHGVGSVLPLGGANRTDGSPRDVEGRHAVGAVRHGRDCGWEKGRQKVRGGGVFGLFGGGVGEYRGGMFCLWFV